MDHDSLSRPTGDDALAIVIETTQDPSLALIERRARHREAARRQVLRLLAELTGVRDDQLRFVREMSGKPRLIGPSSIVFNVSHTDGASLLAVAAAGVEIGVDIEAIADLPDRGALAKRILTRHERDAIDAAGKADATRALLQRWTEKEAALKAAGLGLSRDPQSFSLLARGSTLVPDGVPELKTFRVWPLDLGPRFVGALSADRPSFRIALRTSPMA